MQVLDTKNYNQQQSLYIPLLKMPQSPKQALILTSFHSGPCIQLF